VYLKFKKIFLIYIFYFYFKRRLKELSACLSNSAYRCLPRVKKLVRFDAGNRVCYEWNRLLSWVVIEESVIKFKGNLEHYLGDNRGFK